MPEYRVIFNVSISDKLIDYIKVTYAANIRGWNMQRNHTAFRVQAPNLASLDGALADIRQRMIEIEEIIE